MSAFRGYGRRQVFGLASSPPDGDSYDRYEPALHEKASRIMQEWCDDFLFAKFMVYTRKEKEGFGKERTMAIDAKERVMFTSESAAMVAKNRLQLPEKMPLSFAEYARYAYPMQPAVVAPETHVAASGNINGVVVDGSSKVAV